MAAPAPTPAADGLPAIPRAEGALGIRVVHPIPNSSRPNVDSTYIYGSVGTGAAALTINGVPVQVEPNGAFLAYLPLPQDGTWRLAATAGGRSESASLSYRAPQTAGSRTPARPAIEEIAPARTGRITGGADTLATGSDVAIGRPTPTGTYRWFLPRGARVSVTGQLGDQLRVQMGDSTAWIPAADVTLGGDTTAAPVDVGRATVETTAAWTDVRLPVRGAPFRVESSDTSLIVVLYGISASPPPADVGEHGIISGGRWTFPSPGLAQLHLGVDRPLWGYKAFYRPDGTLVLRLRRPPSIDPMNPLRGRRIFIDPGHPPAGATGPTGLTEAEANLAISLRLADQLRARGAEVMLTRTDNTPSSTSERVQRAVAWDAELLVSVHNNALGEGVNPFRNNGTSVYHFHPFSLELARALNQEIVQVTRIRDIGTRWSNLALVRPTWMPTALTESLFMLIPQQEAALRDPGFLDRLAAAHVRGIERFLRNASSRQLSLISPDDLSGPISDRRSLNTP